MFACSAFVLPCVFVVILSALGCAAAWRLQVLQNQALGLGAPLRNNAEKLHTNTGDTLSSDGKTFLQTGQELTAMKTCPKEQTFQKNGKALPAFPTSTCRGQHWSQQLPEL